MNGQQHWQPVGRGNKKGYVVTRGPQEFRFEHGEFRSKIYTSLADARKLGWAAYFEWQDSRANDPARVADDACKATQERAPASRKRRVGRKRASPDTSTDGILQDQQHSPGSVGPPARPTDQDHKPARQPAAAAAQHKRRKHNAPAANAAAAAAAAADAATQQATADAGGWADQSPSAATDAATCPLPKQRKQAPHAVPAQAAAMQKPSKVMPAKRGRAAAAQAAAPPPAAAAVGAWQQPRPKPRQAKPTRGRTPAAAATATGDAPQAPNQQQQRRPVRVTRARAAAGKAAAPAAAPKTALRARRTRAAAAAGDVDQPGSDPDMLMGDEGPTQAQGRPCGTAARAAQPRKQQPEQQQQEEEEEGGAASDGWCGNSGWTDCDEMSDDSEEQPSPSETASGQGLNAAGAGANQEQQPMDESAGSNWLAGAAPPAQPAAGAAAAAGAAGPGGAAGNAGRDGGMVVWYQGSKPCSAGLEVQLQQQLGKGGFGAVYQVLVKGSGPDSLEGLKLTGPLTSSLKAILKKSKACSRSGAAAARRRSRKGATARSRAGANSAGSNGGSDGSSGSSYWVPMALKVALSFDQISMDMQNNFQTPANFDVNVNQRMREEYDVMAACASSPHILDAFCMGTVLVGGAWRPCILMELSGLGDAERVFIPSSPHYYGPRGVNSVMTQRIVRQAAVALKDLHSLAGSMHLDIKVNNLLVFGSKDSPRIKLCDFGCAKKRSDEPRYGPASGTKDWQAPEQMAAPQNDDDDMDEGPPAGRLDYCTDSWALGLLVLSLRKGQQPFWWVKQQGKLPSEMADSLRDSLASPSSPYAEDSPRGSKLTRLELSFVRTCMASSSKQRPAVKDLLDNDSYLSSRYRGG